jgi:hypothetical protein
VLRIHGKVLGALTLAVLLGHAFLVVPGILWLDAEDEFTSLAYFPHFLVAALCLVAGRVVLAYLPPGDVGSHDPRGLPATLATSAVIGALATESLRGIVSSYVPVHALVLALGLVRGLTLPGAMVPRHGVPDEPSGRLEVVLNLVGLAWSVLLLLTESGVEAFLWLALGLLCFHGLGVARRRRSGRHALLALFALTVAQLGACPVERMLPALSLTLGAACLPGWLRRADRRAGALAGVGFGSLFLGGVDPLALVAALVFVLASRPRQRRFALAWLGGSAALTGLLGWLASSPGLEPRGRLLFAREIAYQLELWGLAWPALLVALVLGALSFPWRGVEWQPGLVEEPRREALALAALLAGCGAALAVPFSPWFEADALVILFPLGALLAGLLLIPPVRVPAGGEG